MYILFPFRDTIRTLWSFTSTIETNAKTFGKNVWSIIPSSDVVRELPENEKNIGFSVEVPHLGKNYHSDL